MRTLITVTVLISVVTCLQFFITKPARFYCGLLNDKPELYFNLEPNWDLNRFRVLVDCKNHGECIEVLSSTEKVADDLTLKPYSIILGYSNQKKDSFIFKAYDEGKVISLYQLKFERIGKYYKPKVNKLSGDIDSFVWHDVSFTTCKRWFIP